MLKNLLKKGTSSIHMNNQLQLQHKSAVFLCNDFHFTFLCPDINDMNNEEVLHLLEERKLCSICLKDTTASHNCSNEHFNKKLSMFKSNLCSCQSGINRQVCRCRSTDTQ